MTLREQTHVLVDELYEDQLSMAIELLKLIAKDPARLTPLLAAKAEESLPGEETGEEKDELFGDYRKYLAQGGQSWAKLKSELGQ
ncbi:MAG: hypothetical protein ACREP9_03350 [Candidatus Dormibacteraceae bacterium]